MQDFRSKGGLYDLVKEKYPDAVVKGAELFDGNFYRDPKTRPIFHSFIGHLKELMQECLPTPTHNFIKDLDSVGKLLRLYTQNIDGLEEKSGLSLCFSTTEKAKVDLKKGKAVLLHGSMDHLICGLCASAFPFVIDGSSGGSDFLEKFKSGEAPECPHCRSLLQKRVDAGKRSISVGVLRPDIVLYNEPGHISGELVAKALEYDLQSHPDLLIVLGTSLRVFGIKKLVKDVVSCINQRRKALKTRNVNGNEISVVFINKTKIERKELAELFDLQLIGDADTWTLHIRKHLNPALKTPAIQSTITPQGRLSLAGSGSSSPSPASNKKRQPITPRKTTPNSKIEFPIIKLKTFTETIKKESFLPSLKFKGQEQEDKENLKNDKCIGIMTRSKSKKDIIAV